MSEAVFRTLSERDHTEEGVSEVKSSGGKEKEEAWTVSTKTRRLAPAFTLSRKDLGADSARNVAAAQDLALAKKKVIRFSREDMMHLWRPSKILGSMAEHTEMVSVPSLHPMCFHPLEQEDVLRLWNADKEKAKEALRGRGRGRGKGEEDEEGGDDEWHRGHHGAHKDGPWDDIEDMHGMSRMAGGLDLADLAAASLKFRSDTRGLEMADTMDHSRQRFVQEDEMERLFREQEDNMMADSLVEDEEQDEPEWADAYITESVQHVQPVAPSEASRSKRSLLFETLNIRTEAPVAAPSIPSPSVHMNNSSNNVMPVLTPLPALMLEESWFYRDPQNTVQGPYETASMRQWHEARYFTIDLPIKLRHWQEFHPLGAVFQDHDVAFGPHSLPSEPFLPPHIRHGPPPMRPLQSEIMDIDIILRQQQEQRQLMEHQRQQLLQQQQLQQQQQQQQLQQQQLQLEQQRRDEQQRIHLAQQLAQQQALEEQQEAARLAHQQQLQLQMRQQQLELQEREKMEKIRQAQYEYDAEQQLLLQQQLKQQQLQMELQQQQQLAQQQQAQQQQNLQHQQQQLLQQKQQQAQQQEMLQQQRLLQQQQELVAQRAQKAAPPAPAAAAWGGSSASGPSLAQIQVEEAKARVTQQQVPSRGSSFQLKSLLGLSSSSSNSLNEREKSVWEASASHAVPVSNGVQPANSLKEILRQEQAMQLEENEYKQQQSLLLLQQQSRAARESAAAEAANISASSWSGDALAQKGKSAKAAPSLRDIMLLEEASMAAAVLTGIAPDSPFALAPRPAPGSWAAKAASLSGGPGPASHKQAPTASSNGIKKSSASIVSAPVLAPSKPVAAAVAGPSFGGRGGFSADLSEWCVAQLAKIRAADSGNSTDPTEFFGVLEYCATLQSAVEVRETFSAYLGSTILVSNFATEFLKRKDGQAGSAVTAASVVSNGSSGPGTAGSKKKGKKGNAEF